MPGHGGSRKGSGRKPYNPSSRDIRHMFFGPQHQQERVTRRRSNEVNESQQQNEPMVDHTRVGACEELDAPPNNDRRSNIAESPPHRQGHPTDETLLEDAGEELDVPLDNDSNPAWSNDTWHDIPLATFEKSGKGRRLSGEVKHQIKGLTKKRRREAAQKYVASGELWEYPKLVRRGHPSVTNLKTSWRPFFRLKVFHWIPLELMPKGWIPKCPHCGLKCIRNGFNNPPRLIYSLHENYLLNAPERLMCKNCRKEARRQKRYGIPKIDRVQYNFLLTDSDIMDQIAEVDPNLVSKFPCTLSHINGIDNEYFALIEHLATKSIGPMAVASMTLSLHEATWQKNELQWLALLRSRMMSPLPYDTNVNIHNLEKCPSYLSRELGGVTPSRTYLMYSFCRRVEKKKKYYDSECIKRAKSSRFGAIDASYKIGKRMKHGSKDKNYDTLHTVINEYTEIIAQKFSNGDGHNELRLNLTKLRDHGYEPELMFTDDPDRDRHFMMDIFPSLKVNVDEKEFQRASNDAAACGLEMVPTRGEIRYIHQGGNAGFALSEFIREIDDASNPEKKLISIDAEWPVNIVSNIQSPGKVNLLQLASAACKDVYIFELYSIKGKHREEFGRRLSRLFEKDDVAFIGCCHKADITRLTNDYPDFNLPTIENERIIDVRNVAISRGIIKRGLGNTTLANLCRVEGFYLPKDSNIRVGELFGSTNGELLRHEDALKYCQRDVEAPLLLYDRWKNKPILTQRLSTYTNGIGTGLFVDIMPASAESTEPIAFGVIVKVDGFSGSRINLGRGKAKRCEIRVLEVFDNDGIIHFPRKHDNSARCRCGRFEHGKINDKCDFFRYRQFGAVPFNTVETITRLRKSERSSTVDNFEEMNEEENEHEGASCEHAMNAQDPENENSSDSDNESDDDCNQVTFDAEGDEDNANMTHDNDCHEDRDDSDSDSPEVLNLEVEQELLLDIDEAVSGILPNTETDGVNEHETFASFVAETRGDEQTEHSALAEEIVQATEYEKIIKAAEEFAKQKYGTSCNYEFSFIPAACEEEGHEEDDNLLLAELTLFSRILGDAFHVMDRIKVPMHHDFKPAYFRALRAAIFIFNPHDVARVKKALKIESNPKAWERLLAFNFKFISETVRRRIPEPDLLFERVRHVFNYYQNRKDAKTGKPLFDKKAKEKSKLVLKMLKSGLLSDPPGYSFYCKKREENGTPKKNKYGLQLYRSVRGTSLLESVHKALITSFGHTISGAMYSDCLLTVVRHNLNWRASMRNRSGFPKLRHYDGEAIDKVNEYYETCFGHLKYTSWVCANDCLPQTQPGQSLYGIVPIHEEQLNTKIVRNGEVDFQRIKTARDYIALRQGTNIPYLPVDGVEPNKLFVTLLKEAIDESSSLSSTQTFVDMAEKWREHVKGGENGIFNVTPVYLARRYKRWRMTASKKEAINTPECRRLMDALEHVPINLSNEMDDELNTFDVEISEDAETVPTNAVIHGPIVHNEQSKQQGPKKRARKRCDRCSDPLCKSKYNGGGCKTHDPPGQYRKSPSKKLKRKQFICQVCSTRGCKGVNNRKACPRYPTEN